MSACLWRRLDTPGHDAARLDRAGDGWRLHGHAVFLAEAGPASLAYEVSLAADWSTVAGGVTGWLGARRVDLDIRRAGGAWILNGRATPGLGHCLDLDLGFTPATNLPQIRRAALAVGEAAEVRVAWIDAEDDELGELRQTYARRSEASYWYESPTAAYSGLLQLAPSGFARIYPGLWEAVSA